MGGGAVLPHYIIARLTFHLLLSYKTILALPECNIKVVNICEMHGMVFFKLWSYALFDGFQRYVQTVRKSDEIVP